jgi:probable HAF family extracellular repeat protein
MKAISCALFVVLFVGIASAADVLNVTPSFTEITGFVTGINNFNDAVGMVYDRSTSSSHGFLRRGTNTQMIDGPGAKTTSVYDVNDRGQVVGTYGTDAGAQAFIWDNGRFKKLEYPGNVKAAPMGINIFGDTVGVYLSGEGTLGFVMTGHRFKTIDVPGSGFTVNGVFRPATAVTRINDDGVVVGFYSDANLKTHGFRLANGRYTIIDAPDAPYGVTQLTGLSNRGQITGNGFVWRLGVFTPVSTTILRVTKTFANDVNDYGMVAGAVYADLRGTVGFIGGPFK